MQQGYIKLYRKIRENPLWDKKPFSKIQAFIDIIFDANYKKKMVFFRDQQILCQRGEYIISILKLSEKWGWSRKKVRNYLNYLSKEDSIRYTKKDNRFIIITICNYDIYNPLENKEGHQKGRQSIQQKDNRGTTEGQQKDITNKENKENKENINTLCGESKNDSSPKKIKKVFEIFSKDSWPYKLSKFQYDCIKYNDPGYIVTEKKIQHNCEEMERLLRIDKRTPEEIGHVIEWIRDDNFEKVNVLSSSKLRKRYSNLKQKYQQNKPKQAHPEVMEYLKERGII